MSRFKQVWVSFFRQSRGFGMIETAILLPIFLLFAFAVIDFGNYLIAKNRIVSANQAIATAIQNNPTMTVSDLNVVIANSLGNLLGGYTTVAIWTSQTVPSLSTARTIAQNSLRDIANPWLADGDPSNDNNAYYVGVYVWRGVPYLTPLPRLLGLVDGTTPGFHDSANSKGAAPNGMKGADSFTFVTLNNVTCPADQVLQSFTGGSATCVPRDRNYSCASGQTLERIVDGNPVCVAKDGTYTCGARQVLKEITSSGAVCVNQDERYECFGDTVAKVFDNGGLICVPMDLSYTCTGNQVLQATSTNGAVCVNKDNGGLSCASGQVVTGIVNGVPTCSARSYSVDVSKRIKSKSSDCRQEPGESTTNMVVVGIDTSNKQFDVYCAPLIVDVD